MPTTIAVDLAKSVFEVAISDWPGRIREHQRLSRSQFSRFLAERRPATVLMEACGSAHFWGRHAQASGHRAVLLPPHAVRPYVPRNKTDRADTEGLLEASRNQRIRPVPVKSIAQQTLTALHRLRSTWLATRTAASTPYAVCSGSSASRFRSELNTLPRESVCSSPMATDPSRSATPSSARHHHRDRQLEKRIDAVAMQLRALSKQTPVVAPEDDPGSRPAHLYSVVRLCRRHAPIPSPDTSRATSA